MVSVKKKKNGNESFHYNWNQSCVTVEIFTIVNLNNAHCQVYRSMISFCSFLSLVLTSSLHPSSLLIALFSFIQPIIFWTVFDHGYHCLFFIFKYVISTTNTTNRIKSLFILLKNFSTEYISLEHWKWDRGNFYEQWIRLKLWLGHLIKWLNSPTTAHRNFRKFVFFSSSLSTRSHFKLKLCKNRAQRKKKQMLNNRKRILLLSGIN